MKYLYPFAFAALVMLTGCQNAPEPDSTADTEVEETTTTQPQTLADAAAEAPAKAHAGAAAEEPAKPEVLDDKGGEVEVGAVKLAAPAGWGRKAASSGFVAAEYVLPRAKGDEADGRLTLSAAGGSVDANVDRWRSQFAPKPTKEDTKKIQVEGLEITTVDFSGDFNDSRGMRGPSVLRKNYRMIAAIIPVGDQAIFVKAYGPQATMEAQAAKFQEFVKTARKK